MGKAQVRFLLCAFGMWLGSHTSGVGMKAFPWLAPIFLLYCLQLFYTTQVFFFPFHLLPGKMIIQILPEVETLGLGPDDVPKLTEQVRDSMLSTYQEISGMMNGASH